MTRNSNVEAGHPAAGRSGNDYLQQGGGGYQSWGADGPSGVAAMGGLPAADLAGGGNRASPHPAPTATSPHAASPMSLTTLLAGVGIGAALMYFLDTSRGARRRHVVRDQVASTARSAQQALRDVIADKRNRAVGAAAEVRGRLTEEDVSDEQLVARVRAELGHHVEHARPIEVVADNGTVTLRGPVGPTELPELVAAVAKVRGVVHVENRLDLRPSPGETPAVPA